MQRIRCSFDEFDKNFIMQPDGFFPVYSCLATNHNGDRVKLFHIDMICEWRVPDGKIKLMEVEFDTEQQYKKIIAYLKLTADLLHAAIRGKIEEIDEFEFAGERKETRTCRDCEGRGRLHAGFLMGGTETTQECRYCKGAGKVTYQL